MSKVSEVNKESCQVVCYKLMAASVNDFTTLLGDHPLRTWLCTSVFLNFCAPNRTESTAAVVAVFSEEAIVARYICGFICCKLEHRNDFPEYVEGLRGSEK